ncbi:MAG: N-acetylmuramoyl-L-alanine amidase family protein [Firmicutes bacterium]|nr:N-acetylmuramoyl-L-alanine amidase family protein [Bacillota bacterium]
MITAIIPAGAKDSKTDSIKAIISGKAVTIQSITDADGNVMVSCDDPEVKELFKSYDAEISWNPEKKSAGIKAGANEAKILPSAQEIQWGDNSITLSAPPKIVRGKLYIPLDSIQKFIEARIVFDDEKKVYYIDPLIKNIELKGEKGNYRLIITASNKIKPQCFALREPDRFVVDIPDSILVIKEREIENQELSTIRFSQNKTKPNMVRIVIPQSNSAEVESLPANTPNEISFSIRLPNIYPLAQNFETQKITGLAVEKGRNGIKIKLRASGPFQYEWHRLKSPDNRLFIDIPQGMLVAAERKFTLDDPYIAEVRVAQFQKEPMGIVRLVLQLNEPAECSINSSSTAPDQLEIEIHHKTIDPSVAEYRGNGATAFPSKGKVICIDPGHGGSDCGALNKSMGLYEKYITLDIAKKLAAMLIKDGWNVVLTRDTDVDVAYPGASAKEELGARVKIANNLNADLFISIHCNASLSYSSQGTSTHWYKSKDRLFASDVQDSLISCIGRSDRGIAQNRFYVLAHSRMPAILIETAFISNPEEGKLLSTPEFRQKLAEAIYGGLKTYVARNGKSKTVFKLTNRSRRR